MKNILPFLLFIAFSTASAQYTYIPDPIFEQELISLGIDSDGIVNEQLLSSDALAVTSLTLYYAGSNNGNYIYDLTGLEDFVNLESLTINGTMVEEFNLSTLVNLKYLNCSDNMLTSLDVSNNVLLEYLDITSGGDVYPMNSFTEIDLSNNPNIHTLRAWGAGSLKKINLNNNNNNENMNVYFSCWLCWDYPVDYIIGHVCIEVDNPELAQNNEYPYSEWTLQHYNFDYTFTDDVVACVLNTPSFTTNKISFYPNPVADILYFETSDMLIEKVIIFDLSGRKVLDQNQVTTLDVSTFEKGNYILKIVSDQGTQTEKIIIK
jgi:hypothetical protein